MTALTLTDQEIAFFQDLISAEYGSGWSPAVVQPIGFAGVEPPLTVCSVQQKLQDMMNAPHRVRARLRWNETQRKAVLG